MRKRVREKKYENYFKALSSWMDLQKMMVENLDIHAIYEYSSEDWTFTDYKELSPHEKKMVHYCDLIISLCESVWVANKEKVLPDEWRYWKVWIDQLNNSPAFRWTVAWVEEDYDEDFLLEIIPNKKIIRRYEK